MSNRGREMLRVLAGGYLVFTGFQLARRVLAERPAHSTFFLIASGICAAVGIWAIWISIKGEMEERAKEKRQEDAKIASEEQTDDNSETGEIVSGEQEDEET